MRDVYLNFRLPWSAKIAAGMFSPGKWWPFEIYLTPTWIAPYFDHTYLGFPSIKSNGFFTKTKEASIIYSNLDTFNFRRSWNTCFRQISSQRSQTHSTTFFPNFQSFNLPLNISTSILYGRMSKSWKFSKGPIKVKKLFLLAENFPTSPHLFNLVYRNPIHSILMYIFLGQDPNKVSIQDSYM
jgi:hypothetical protein